MQKIIKLIVIALIAFGCKKNTNQTSQCSTNNSLYNFYSYKIGVALDINKINFNNDYKKIAIDQFNSITPENSFKQSNLNPVRDVYYWEEVDSIVSFCEKYNKRLHGHTLIWHQQLPVWLDSFKGSEEEWNSLFKNYIETVVKHLKNKVTGWDVVNEAFNEDGTLRNTVWLQKIGPNYIEKAFRYAHQADNNVKLFYNDFNLESNPTKLNAVISYLNSLRSRGVRVDGIGLQTHIRIQYPEITQITSALKSVSLNNYMVHLSELDISVNPTGKGVILNSNILSKQSDLYKALFLIYKSLPESQQYGITFWGVSDADTWLRSYFNKQDYPLLFDDNYAPKPSYCNLIK